jgi:HAD superfamily hydrolase (TIGR01509 family)
MHATEQEATHGRLKAVFLDIGNTLVFPDRQVTLRPLHDRGVFPTREHIRTAERVARETLDQQQLATATVSVDRGYWDIYYRALLSEIGIDDNHLRSELAQLAGQSGNWNVLADNAEKVLRTLKQSYRLGVISNSDERLAALLARLGIDGFFDCIVASSVVGHEKPDARIFEAAVQSLGTEAGEAMYVGDIYSVDYVGATAIGMQSILMDTYGIYRDLPVPRIESLQELPSVLNKG